MAILRQPDRCQVAGHYPEQNLFAQISTCKSDLPRTVGGDDGEKRPQPGSSEHQM
jgi:hypothetical protein